MTSASFAGGFDPAQFLLMLHAVHRLLAPAEGSLVRLIDLYPIIARLPAARPHYGRADFAQDVYLLDRYHSQACATSGLVFRLDRGATAARNRSNLLLTTGGQGQELSYYGLEFLTTSRFPEIQAPLQPWWCRNSRVV